MNSASIESTTIAPDTERQLPDSAGISYAQLCVADSGQALRFYRDLLGLVETRIDGSTTYLSTSATQKPLLLITEDPDAKPKDIRSPGLFHLAFLYPRRKDLAAMENELPFPQGVSIGHIHLQVSSLRAAEEFYHKTLGFDVMQRNFPGALFLSAGGYHHHVGVNVWNSRGISPAPAHSRGLTRFGIHLGNEQALRSRAEQLRPTQFWVKDSINGFVVHDGDNIHIDIT